MKSGLRFRESIIGWLVAAAGWSSTVCMIAIFVFVFAQAGPLVPRLDFLEFFTSTRWIPSPARGNSAHYGALGLIVGTLATTVLGLLMAVPVGLAAAVYISELAPPRLRELLKIVVELLAVIPSIVWGFIGLMVLGPWVAGVTGAPLGTNLLTGALILALMSVPVIVSIAEDALRAVPEGYREAGLALGASPVGMVFRVLFPAARTGLLAACLLGFGRAIGETMAVLLATGHANRIPHSLVDPVRTLTATIAAELGEAPKGSDHYRALFVIGALLLLMTVATNVLADIIVRRSGHAEY